MGSVGFELADAGLEEGEATFTQQAATTTTN